VTLKRIERFALIAEVAEAEPVLVAQIVVQAERAIMLVDAAGRVEISDIE